MKIELLNEYEIPVFPRAQMLAEKKELFIKIKHELDALGIDPSIYVLGGDGNHGELCIDLDGSVWVVYYCERGERYNGAFFAGARDAANYFLGEIFRANIKTLGMQPFIKPSII
jgi:hypothetical protein